MGEDDVFSFSRARALSSSPLLSPISPCLCIALSFACPRAPLLGLNKSLLLQAVVGISLGASAEMHFIEPIPSDSVSVCPLPKQDSETAEMNCSDC